LIYKDQYKLNSPKIEVKDIDKELRALRLLSIPTRIDNKKKILYKVVNSSFPSDLNNSGRFNRGVSLYQWKLLSYGTNKIDFKDQGYEEYLGQILTGSYKDDYYKFELFKDELSTYSYQLGWKLHNISYNTKSQTNLIYQDKQAFELIRFFFEGYKKKLNLFYAKYNKKTKPFLLLSKPIVKHTSSKIQIQFFFIFTINSKTKEKLKNLNKTSYLNPTLENLGQFYKVMKNTISSIQRRVEILKRKKEKNIINTIFSTYSPNYSFISTKSIINQRSRKLVMGKLAENNINLYNIINLIFLRVKVLHKKLEFKLFKRACIIIIKDFFNYFNAINVKNVKAIKNIFILLMLLIKEVWYINKNVIFLRKVRQLNKSLKKNRTNRTNIKKRFNNELELQKIKKRNRNIKKYLSEISRTLKLTTDNKNKVENQIKPIGFYNVNMEYIWSHLLFLSNRYNIKNMDNIFNTNLLYSSSELSSLPNNVDTSNVIPPMTFEGRSTNYNNDTLSSLTDLEYEGIQINNDFLSNIIEKYEINTNNIDPTKIINYLKIEQKINKEILSFKYLTDYLEKIYNNPLNTRKGQVYKSRFNTSFKPINLSNFVDSYPLIDQYRTVELVPIKLRYSYLEGSILARLLGQFLRIKRSKKLERILLNLAEDMTFVAAKPIFNKKMQTLQNYDDFKKKSYHGLFSNIITKYTNNIIDPLSLLYNNKDNLLDRLNDKFLSGFSLKINGRWGKNRGGNDRTTRSTLRFGSKFYKEPDKFLTRNQLLRGNISPNKQFVQEKQYTKRGVFNVKLFLFTQ
jgi:hypothetical protein